ncbi:MAG: response regulator transcription factor [Actinomycetales bacterium]
MAPAPASLLVVEDDDTIGSLLRRALERAGYAVRWLRSGAAAVIDAREHDYDLVLLDLNLPDVDGVDVCRQLRAMRPTTVIVMLTARRQEMDVIVGLDAGADDYLVKPFRTAELLARLRAHLRRLPPPLDVTEPLVLGDLTVDRAARKCLLAGEVVPLRPKEFDLLTRLAESAGTLVPRDLLMRDVWDEQWTGSTKTLDVTMAALRKTLAESAEALSPRLGRAPRLPSVATLRGHGYRLDPPVEPAVTDVSSPPSPDVPSAPSPDVSSPPSRTSAPPPPSPDVADATVAHSPFRAD